MPGLNALHPLSLSHDSKACTIRRRAPTDPVFEWRMPSPIACGMLFLGCIIGAGMWRQWVWILDMFTLTLHEAGHPLVGFVSANLMIYGGTFFQLLFPWLTKRHFEKQKNPAGVVFGLYWMAASIHNVGVYVADARAKILPLVGGLNPDDAHDWAEILSRWGLLRYDTAIEKMLMLAAWLMLGWAMQRCYKEVLGDTRGVSRTTMTQKNKEDALVEQFKHLRTTTDSNPDTSAKDTPQEKKTFRPNSEEEN